MSNKVIIVNKILEICRGELVSGNRDLEIDSFSKDSRTIKNGDMYLGIRGEKVDGNNYIEDAFKNGAIGCITDKEVDNKLIEKFPDRTVIKVKDTITAIQELARYKRSLYNIPVIAVTGSVRKNKHKRYNC